MAAWPDPVIGQRRRIEHGTNSSEQRLAVARNMLVGPEAAAALTSVPYVIHGRTRGADRMRIAEGGLEQRKFTAL